jgi:hypothetical protein
MKETLLFKTDHARIEQAFCSAPGLFVSLPRKLPKGVHLDITYETTDATFAFFGKILGIVELRVFQGLLALTPLSGPNNTRLLLQKSSQSEAGKEHLKTLEPKETAIDKDSLVIKTTFYELAKEIGYADSSFDSGYQIKAIKKALETLWTVSVLVKSKLDPEKSEGARIISLYQTSKGGKFTVAINPRLAEGIMGKRKYSRLDMTEIRGLKSDVSRFIHQRLCGFIDPGKSHKVILDTLCEYPWPIQALNINTIKTRKKAVKAALKELQSLGWTITEYAPDKFEITRRAIPN